MPTTTNWRQDLWRLEGHGLALIPIGAKAPERKAPVDPATGYGLKNWQHSTGYRAEELERMNPAHVIAVGVNTGHGGILVLDIDGASAAEWVRQRGVDPSTAITWHITRTTDATRYKLVFRLSAEQQEAFPQTKLLLRTTQGEALEIYYQPGAQVLVLGEHCKSGGMYSWVNDPGWIATPTDEWMQVFHAIKDKVQELRSKGDTSRPPRVRGISSVGRWQSSGPGRPCPICGRERSAACTHITSGDRTVASCYHGSGDLLCPQGLKAGEVITGYSGGRWAFVRTYVADCLGEKSLFVNDQPKAKSMVNAPAPKPTAGTPANAPSTDVPAVDAFRRDIKAVVEENLAGSELIAYATQKAVEYDISPSQAAEIRKQLIQEYDATIQAEQETTALAKEAEHEHFRRNSLTLQRLVGDGPLADAIREVTGGLNTDDFSSVCTFLGTVAGVLPLGTTVRGNWKSFVVPANAYIAVVGDTGSGKTHVLKALTEMPLSALHRTATFNYNRAIEKWHEDNKGVKLAERSPQPDFIYVYVNGYTAEAADEQLAIQETHGRPLLIYNDELSRIFESLDCYSSKGKRGIGEAQLLRMFDGSGNVELRVKVNRRYSQCQISILGGLQDEVFAKLAKDGDPYGTFARLLLCKLPPIDKSIDAPYEEPSAQSSSIAASELYLQDFIARISRQLPAQYVLDPAAMRVFHAVIATSKRMIRDADLKAHKAVYGKRAGYVLRFAVLLHVLRIHQHQATHDQPITTEVLTVAMDCVDQLQWYAINAHSCIASQADNAIHNLGQRILRYISSRPGGVTASQFWKNNLSVRERSMYPPSAVQEFFSQLHAAGQASLDRSGRSVKLVPLRSTGETE